MNTKELIIEQLAVLGQQVVDELNLPSMTYDFDDSSSGTENKYLACAHFEGTGLFTYTAIRSMNRISFNTKGIERFVKANFPPLARQVGIHSVIRHLIMHEHYHIWQHVHDTDNCIREHNKDPLNISSIYGHGTSNIEEEANQYCLRKAVDDDEYMLFEYQRLVQRQGLLSPIEERKQLISIYGKIVKRFTIKPILRNALGIAIIGSAIYGITKLINKRGK